MRARRRRASVLGRRDAGPERSTRGASLLGERRRSKTPATSAGSMAPRGVRDVREARPTTKAPSSSVSYHPSSSHPAGSNTCLGENRLQFFRRRRARGPRVACASASSHAPPSAAAASRSSAPRADGRQLSASRAFRAASESRRGRGGVGGFAVSVAVSVAFSVAFSVAYSVAFSVAVSDRLLGRLARRPSRPSRRLPSRGATFFAALLIGGDARAPPRL